MRFNKQIQQFEKLAPDVNHNRWVKHWRNQRCRYMPKMALLDGQKGRTHKRKQRGTRKQTKTIERASQRMKMKDYRMWKVVYGEAWR